MADRRSNGYFWFSCMAAITIKSDKTVKDENGIVLKFPKRICKKCSRYPCVLGMDKLRSNFAAYGCTYFLSKRKKKK